MAHFVLSAFADEASASLDGQIAALTRNHIPCVELRSLDGKNVTQLSDSELSWVKSRLDASGIRVSAIGSPIGKISILDDFASHLDLFRRTIEIAQKLEAPYIRLFSFFMPQDADPKTYRNAVLERMTAFLDVADGSGIACCHENEKGIYGDIPERVLDLHQTLGPRLKCVFDPANFLQCGAEILPAFQLLRPYLTYMHIKDAWLASGKVVPAGHGDGQLPELLRQLATDFAPATPTDASPAFAPWLLSVEPHLTVFAGYEQLGDHTELGTDQFVYPNNDAAFDAACTALQTILAAQ